MTSSSLAKGIISRMDKLTAIWQWDRYIKRWLPICPVLWNTKIIVPPVPAPDGCNRCALADGVYTYYLARQEQMEIYYALKQLPAPTNETAHVE